MLAEARYAKGLKDRGITLANRFDTTSASTRAYWAMQWARTPAGGPRPRHPALDTVACPYGHVTPPVPSVLTAFACICILC